jgi:hypothetical protein
MAATQQALLMASDNAVTVPEACVADPYYSCGPTNDPYWANVVLMLHGNGANDGATITDSSSYARASTAYRSGSKTVTTEKKFGTASITAAAVTGSHQFSDSTDFALSGAFTFEFWIKTVVQANEGYLFAGYESGSGGRYWIVNTAGTTLNFVLWPITISLITLTQGQWTHVAISRDGSGYFRIFKNGVELYGATHAISYTGAIEFSVTNLALEQWTTQASFAGYLDDVRFTQGIARYTGNFNIPTAAFPDALETVWDPADPRTVLSLHAEDTDDSSCYQPKTVTLAGSAAVSTTEKKFDTASFSVANAGTSTANGVVITDHQDFDFGTGDFTIEMWAYRSSNTYYGTLFYFTEAAEFSLLVAPTTGNIVLNYRSSGGTQVNISTGVTFPLTTWQHVVVQRRGTNFEFYLNGALGNTTAITGGASSTVNSAGSFYLGRTNASSALTWAGYIDEVRVTKGVARYTAAFDPATMPNCDSVVPGNIVAVPGTSPLTGMSVAVQQQTIGDQNGAVALSGVSATVNAGGLFSDSVTSSKTVALTGRSVTVSRGTLAVPAYPNLISVSTTTIEAVATGNTAKLTFTFFTDGTYTVVDQALTTRTSGTWIDTAQTNYSIPAISNQYRVVTINIFAGTSYTYSTLPFTLGTSFSVVIQNLASSTLNIFDFQLTISPTSTNPRYAEPYYYGTHRFKAVLSNDMS